jgi:hypothetical protein
MPTLALKSPNRIFIITPTVSLIVKCRWSGILLVFYLSPVGLFVHVSK